MELQSLVHTHQNEGWEEESMRIGSGEAGSMTGFGDGLGGARPRTEYRAHPGRVPVHRHRERARQGRERTRTEDRAEKSYIGKGGQHFWAGVAYTGIRGRIGGREAVLAEKVFERVWAV